jgi:hypothetical protein
MRQKLRVLALLILGGALSALSIGGPRHRPWLSLWFGIRKMWSHGR